MKAIVATRWKCDFCHRTLSHKSAMIKHEKLCWHNPNSRTCITCGYFIEGTCEIDIAPLGTEYSVEAPWEPLREVTQKIRDCAEWEASKDGGEE